MPLPISFSPSRLRRRQQRFSGNAEKSPSSKEAKKIDSAVWQKFWENSRKSEASQVGRPLTPALPYSKDFGTFDLTLCEGPDGRCIVLVEYDQRTFLNGKQVFLKDDGTIVDQRGISDRLLSRCYQCVIEAKYDVRRKDEEAERRSSRRSLQIKRRSEPPLRDEESRERPHRKSVDNLRAGRSSVRFCLGPSKDGTCAAEKSQDESPRNIKAELQHLESCFSESIAYLCRLIVELSESNHAETESAKSEDFVLDQHAEYLVNMMTRLSDQFQSMVRLSSTLREEDADDTSGHRDAPPRCTDDKRPNGQKGQREEEDDDESSSEEGVVISVWPRENKDVPSPDAIGGESKEGVKLRERDKNALDNLRHENKELLEEVEALDTDMAHAQKLLEEMEQRLSETAKERDRLQRQINDASSESDSRQFGDVGRRLTEDMLIDDLDDACGHNTAFYAGSDSESQAEDWENDESSTTVTSVGGSHATLKTEIKRLRNVYDEFGKSLETLNEDNIRLKARITSLQKEKEATQNKLDHEKRKTLSMKTDVEKLDGLNAELENRVATLEKMNTNMETELQSLREDHTEKTVTGRVLERKLGESVANCQLLQEKETEHREDLERLAKQHLEESTRAARMAKNAAKLEVEVTELKSALERATVDHHVVRAENDANSAAREKAESLCRQLEEGLKLARAEETDAMENVRRLTNNNDILHETVSSLEERKNELIQKVFRLEASNSTIGKQNDVLKIKLESLQREDAEVKQRCDALVIENGQMAETVTVLKMTNADIRSRLVRWEEDNSDMSGKMRRLVQVKEELHGMLRQLNGLNTDIESRFELMDSEYEQLEEKLKGSGDILKMKPQV